MKTRYKTLLVLLLTLLIGMVLGVLINNTITRYRFKKMATRIQTPEGFMHRMESIIEPEESQKKAIREILIKHSKLFSEMQIKIQKQFSSHMDSLRKELNLILTDEQKKRLNTRDSIFPGKGSRFRPPFGGKPPEGMRPPFFRPDSLDQPGEQK